MDLRFGQDHQEWTTLAQASSARRWRWSSALAISLSIHLAILAILCLLAAPIFVRPTLLAHGKGGNATPTSVMLYLPQRYSACCAKHADPAFIADAAT